MKMFSVWETTDREETRNTPSQYMPVKPLQKVQWEKEELISSGKLQQQRCQKRLQAKWSMKRRHFGWFSQHFLPTDALCSSSMSLFS